MISNCYNFLGSSEIVSLLLDCGAIIDCKNSLGKTAANLAAFTGMFCFSLIKLNNVRSKVSKNYNDIYHIHFVKVFFI